MPLSLSRAYTHKKQLLKMLAREEEKTSLLQRRFWVFHVRRRDLGQSRSVSKFFVTLPVVF